MENEWMKNSWENPPDHFQVKSNQIFFLLSDINMERCCFHEEKTLAFASTGFGNRFCEVENDLQIWFYFPILRIDFNAFHVYFNYFKLA